MGTDIHVMVERRSPDEKWHAVDTPQGVWDDRNYGAFGWLADIRNYSAIPPLFAGRGIPEGSPFASECDEYCLHSATHFMVSELLAVDYLASVEDRRCVEILADGVPLDIGSGRETCDPGQGEKMCLGQFLGIYWMQGLLKLAALGSPDDTRVTVAFDS